MIFTVIRHWCRICGRYIKYAKCMREIHVNIMKWTNPAFDFSTMSYLCSSCYSRVNSLRKEYSVRSPNKPPSVEFNIILHWNDELQQPDFTKSEPMRLKCRDRNERGRFLKKTKTPLKAPHTISETGRIIRVTDKIKEAELIKKILKNEEAGLTLYKAGWGKGRGVKTTTNFFQGDFVCLYEGKRLVKNQALECRSEYEKRKVGSYMFEVYHDGKLCVIDATQNDQTIGRFINHEPEGENNLNKNKIVINSVVYIYFTAKFDIPKNTILSYNYADPTATHDSQPWMVKKKKK